MHATNLKLLILICCADIGDPAMQSLLKKCYLRLTINDGYVKTVIVDRAVAFL